MTQTAAKFQSYAESFLALTQGFNGDVPGWAQELRDTAWSTFQRVGFPTARRGNERWKYTSVRPLAATEFSIPLELGPDSVIAVDDLRRLAPWQDDWVNLVFVDGLFSPVLSAGDPGNHSAVAGTLAKHLAGNSIVQEHLGRYTPLGDDGLPALNTAFLRDGAFIHIPAGVAVPSVLNLIYLTPPRSQPNAAFPRTLIVAGSNSSVTINESYVGMPDSMSESGHFTNAVTEIVLEDGARVNHHQLVKEGPNAFHVGHTRVSQNRDSAFSSSSFALGSALTRIDIQVTLDGPGSSCDLGGLYLTKGSQHIDNFINIDHATPYTTSNLRYKGILDGDSRAVFGGTVLVRKDSQKAMAHQSDKNLLLSDSAEVDSKPSLLIYADDVQCGHGATAGNIDPMALFYLRSRGLDHETASKFLIHAFAGEIIQSVELEPLREYLDQLFQDELPAATIRIGGAQ
ncbi:MAG: Fe-S cluster assembly protein SufD [SAR202 cluster bacterium Io17-Chloro-G9]|nr:MAG: Fe-S cluster assembly protein SufD [SAR202 cluster bacterium Io17-Chloro-G9]